MLAANQNNQSNGAIMNRSLVPPQVITGSGRLPSTPTQQYPMHNPEDIARTIYVGNVNPEATCDSLQALLETCGTVTYCKINGDPTQPSRYAFVEFDTVENAKKAFGLNGHPFGGMPLRINHSTNPIIKSYPISDERIKRKLRKAADRIARSIEEFEREEQRREEREYEKERERERVREREHQRERSPGYRHDRYRYSPYDRDYDRSYRDYDYDRSYRHSRRHRSHHRDYDYDYERYYGDYEYDRERRSSSRRDRDRDRYEKDYDRGYDAHRYEKHDRHSHDRDRHSHERHSHDKDKHEYHKSSERSPHQSVSSEQRSD